MFARIREWIRGAMAGRNGMDALGYVWLFTGIICNLIGSFTGKAIFVYLAYIPLFLAFFRMFSRDLERRYQENLRFTQFFARIRGRKDHRYFRCPSCKTMVRVPRGKGMIRITCPACKMKFQKKT